MPQMERKNAEKKNDVIDIEKMWKIWENNGPELSLSCEICTLLKNNNYRSELSDFLQALPKQDEYQQSETLNRARIYSAFWKCNYQEVFTLIKENEFTDGEDLIDIWDVSHYCEEELKKQKPLTPLSRFRIRQRYESSAHVLFPVSNCYNGHVTRWYVSRSAVERYVPPKSILPSGKRKTAAFSTESKDVLRSWLEENIHYPYPTREMKQYLACKTGLTFYQVSTWFANSRRKLYIKIRSDTNNQKPDSAKYQINLHGKRGRKNVQQSCIKIKPEINDLTEATSEVSTHCHGNYMTYTDCIYFPESNDAAKILIDFSNQPSSSS